MYNKKLILRVVTKSVVVLIFAIALFRILLMLF